MKLEKNDFNRIIFEFVKNQNIPNATNTKQFGDFFKTNEIIYTLINYKANKCSQIKPIIYKTKNKSLLNEYNSRKHIEKSHKEKTDFAKLKAEAITEIYLDDIGVNSELARLKRLLTKPNEWQSFSDFIYSLSAFSDISGWNAVYINKGEQKVPLQIYSLPTHQIEIIAGGQFDPIKFYDLNGYTNRRFLAEECVSMRSFSPDYERQGSHLYGTSKVGVAYADLQTMLEAKLREYTSFKTGDSAHVLFPKHVDAQQDAANDPGLLVKLKERVYQALRGKDNHQAAVVGQELGHINLSSMLKDSRTVEVKEEIKQNIAAIWGIGSKVVFNEKGGSTYNNLKEDKKNSLQNGVFPYLGQLESLLTNEIVEPYFKVKLGFDYDVYPELNTDTITEMKDLSQVNFLTENEKRAWFDFDATEGGDSLGSTIEPINLDY